MFPFRLTKPRGLFFEEEILLPRSRMPWVDFRKMCCRQVFPGACPEFQTPRYRDLQPLQLRPPGVLVCFAPKIWR